MMIVGPQSFPMLRLFLDHLQRRQRARRRRRTDRRAENNLPRTAAQVLNQRLAPRHESPTARQRLRETARNQIHTLRHTELVAHAAPIPSENPKTVGVV